MPIDGIVSCRFALALSSLPPSTYRSGFLSETGIKKKQEEKDNAHTVIRTQDLVITSDALYQLSHASCFQYIVKIYTKE